MNKVELESTVVVHYNGTFESGEVFDSSYIEGREPIQVTLGQGQLIKGFENGLIGMEVGEKKKVVINPEDAYGLRNEAYVAEVPKESVPEDVIEGVILTGKAPEGDFSVFVKEIKEKTVILDGNHPLAGKTLIFELELIDIK